MASLCRQGGAALLLGTAIWANGAEPSQPEPEKAEAQASESPEETPAAASEEASETPSESENVEAEASEERAGAKRMEAQPPESATENTGACYALLVGVNDYGRTLKPLKYAASDVKRLAKALEKIGFPRGNIVTLASGDGEAARPSRENILAELENLVEKARSSEHPTIFVAFSGHGFETVKEDGKGGVAAFAPTDVQVEFGNDGAPYVKAESAILMTDVIKQLNEVEATFKFLIVDACREPANLEEGTKGIAPVYPNVSKAFANLKDLATDKLAFVQGCGPGEVSWESSDLEAIEAIEESGKVGGGLLVHYFVKGILGESSNNNDDDVMFHKLCRYLCDNISHHAKYTLKVPEPWQTPVSNYITALEADRPADFIVVKSSKPAEAMRKLADAKVRRQAVGLENLEEALKLLDDAIALYVYVDEVKLEVLAEKQDTLSALAAAYKDAAKLESVKADNAESANDVSAALEKAAASAKKAREYFEQMKKLATEYEHLAKPDDAKEREYADWSTKCENRLKAWQLLDEAEEALAAKNLTTATAKLEESLRLWESARGRTLKTVIDGKNYEAEMLYRRGRKAAFGLDGKIDAKAGVTFLLEAAEIGSVDAKSALAVLYYEGSAAAPPNFDEAFKFAKEAAEVGNPWAQYVLGECYRTGLGAEKNETLAKEAYAKARAGFEERADDDLLASTYFGLCCYWARGGKKDSAEALRRFRKAADDGLPLAAYWLAYCNQYGSGVMKDAFDEYKKSAEAGYPAAMNQFGVLCEGKKDYENAFKWYQEGANAGHAGAMYNLGRCYRGKIGVKKDEEKALENYQKSAEAGYARAMAWLGKHYYERWDRTDWPPFNRGDNAYKSKKEAFKRYEKGAKLGNADAMLGLALCYEEGKAVAQNLDEAKTWYEKAKATDPKLTAEADAGLERVKEEIAKAKKKEDKKASKEKKEEDEKKEKENEK